MQIVLNKQLLAPALNPWFWLRVVLLVTFVTILDFMDPFGWNSAPEQSAQLFMQKFTSPLHNAEKSQDEVTVILIDDNYFAPNKPLWPIPSREFKFKILKKILKHKPKAIFLDLTYPDAPREVTKGGKNTREEALIELANSLRKSAKQTPILIGDALSGINSKQCTNQGADYYNCVQQNLLSQNILTKSFLQHAFAKPSKLQVVDVGHNLGETYYPLVSSGLENTAERQPYFSSPALALHKIYAQEDEPDSALQKLWQANKASAQKQKPHWLNAYQAVQQNNKYQRLGNDDQLSTKWNYYTSPDMGMLRQILGDNTEYDCQLKPLPNSWLIRIKDSFIEYISVILNSKNSAQSILCPSVKHYSASLLGDVRRLESKNEETTINQVALNQFIKSSIQDKIVMVGVNLPQAKDTTYSPLNGHIPGVFLHAAALQNLIDSDVDFSRTHDDEVKWFFSGLFVLAMAYLHAILPVFIGKPQTTGLVIAKVILLSFVPWLAIWGLSYTNIPLAYAFIGLLVALFGSIEEQIKQINANQGAQKAILKFLANLNALTQRLFKTLIYTRDRMNSLLKKSASILMKSMKGLRKQKSHS